MATKTRKRRFVVQRHRASRLHYDLRFEIDGVLVSWAVPKGPTLDATVKRLAVHVEDHSMEYAAFEGVIGRSQYGRGDVIVWDQGTWEPYGTEDPAAAVASGELHAEMHGEKLKGRLVLIHRGRDSDEWLLIHKRDEYAVEGWDPEAHPRSVVSGRTNEDVAANPYAVSEDELAALAELGKTGGTWQVFGRRLKVTSLDTVLFPPRGDEPPVTKREFLQYAARIAPAALPHLTGRALNLHRRKELPAHAPSWLPRWDNPLADPVDTRTYLVVDEPAALVWAAGFGALEWHPWTSRTTAPEFPTYALFDLDPGERTTWEDLLHLARLHRTALEELGLRGHPKVSGRRGIQIWVPIRPGSTFDETRGWVERVSRIVGAVAPELVSWKSQRKARGGRARLDYRQNAINKTLVAPYSPRPGPGAPVSVPIEWHELDDPELRPDRWTIRTVFDRLETDGDPFRGALVFDQELPTFG